MMTFVWIDAIIAFMAVSSALLLVMGALGYLVTRLLKIRGIPNLWICMMLMLVPLAYPLHDFLPDLLKVPVPMLSATSPVLEPVWVAALETNLPDVGAGPGSLIGSSAGTSAEAAGGLPGNGTALSDSDSASVRPALWKLLVASAWIFPLLFLLLRSLLMLRRTKRLPGHADPVKDPVVLELLHQCAAQTRVRKVPELRTAENLPTPMVMGFLHPAILLPGHLLTPPLQEGLRFALLHELKHLKRRDNWWLLVESVVSAAYFFHPVIYWAKKQIHEEWEYLCDHHVVQVTRKSASYADFLLQEVWRHGRGSQHPTAAVPFFSSVSKTARRVRSILENSPPTFFTKLRGRIAVAVVFVSLLSLLTFKAAPPRLEQTADAAPVDTHLTVRTAETIPPAAAINTGIAIAPAPADAAAPALALSQASSAALSPAGEKTVPDISTATLNSAKRTSEVAAPRVAEEDGVSADSQAPVARITPGDAEPQTPVDTAVPVLTAKNEAPQPQKGAERTEPVSTDTATENVVKEYLGTPKSYLLSYQIRDTRIMDNQTILFIMRGGGLYLNRLPVPCTGLYMAGGFSYRTGTAGRISKFDLIHAVPQDRFPGSAAMLGQFYPYHYKGKKLDAIRLLKDGLLAKLVAAGAFENPFPDGK